MNLNELWQEQFKIGSWGQWNIDLDSSTLTFSQDGRPRVVANIVVVGTTKGSQWEWSWGNRHMPDSSRVPMTAVREFGEEKGWAPLTALFLDEFEEDMGWDLSAIAAHILEAEAAYRCPINSGDFVFVLAFATRFVN